MPEVTPKRRRHPQGDASAGRPPLLSSLLLEEVLKRLPPDARLTRRSKTYAAWLGLYRATTGFDPIDKARSWRAALKSARLRVARQHAGMGQ